jgi:hypothetical protein
LKSQIEETQQQLGVSLAFDKVIVGKEHVLNNGILQRAYQDNTKGRICEMKLKYDSTVRAIPEGTEAELKEPKKSEIQIAGEEQNKYVPKKVAVLEKRVQKISFIDTNLYTDE